MSAKDTFRDDVRHVAGEILFCLQREPGMTDSYSRTLPEAIDLLLLLSSALREAISGVVTIEGKPQKYRRLRPDEHPDYAYLESGADEYDMVGLPRHDFEPPDPSAVLVEYSDGTRNWRGPDVLYAVPERES